MQKNNIVESVLTGIIFIFVPLLVGGAIIGITYLVFQQILALINYFKWTPVEVIVISIILLAAWILGAGTIVVFDNDS